MKRVILTGSSGYVGRFLLSALLDRGYELTCLLRSSSFSKLGSLADRVNLVDIDFAKDDLGDASNIEGDVLIHLVAILKEEGSTTYKRFNFLSAKRMMDIAKQNGIGRFLFMSAAGAPPFLKGYMVNKLRAEDYLRSSGLNWTIFKPSLIYNRDSFRGKNLGYIRYFNFLYDLASYLPFVGNFALKWKPVSINDLASSFIHAIDSDDFIFRTLYSYDISR